MINMSIQPLWLTHFIQILLVHKFQLKTFIVGVFSYKAHFRPQISSNVNDTSHRIINCAERWNWFEGTPRVAYTFHAGPNVVMYAPNRKVAGLLL